MIRSALLVDSRDGALGMSGECDSASACLIKQALARSNSIETFSSAISGFVPLETFRSFGSIASAIRDFYYYLDSHP